MKMNKKAAALGGLAAVAVVGGTWAYFNQTAAITNPFSTGRYGGSIVESFNPSEGDNWQPGATVDKEVVAENTGNSPLLVRVKMAETWSRNDQNMIAINSEKQPDFTAVKQANAEDGLVEGDQTVVWKNLAENDAWTQGEDGYWYFCDKLEGGEATVNLLNSIKLDEKTDMGLIANKYYYIAVEKGADEPDFNADTWNEMKATTEEEAQKELAEIAEGQTDKDFYMTLETKTDENAKGYSDAGYTLNITTEAVQATPDAVEAEWTTAPAELMENILK